MALFLPGLPSASEVLAGLSSSAFKRRAYAGFRGLGVTPGAPNGWRALSEIEAFDQRSRCPISGEAGARKMKSKTRCA